MHKKDDCMEEAIGITYSRLNSFHIRQVGKLML